MTGEEVAESVEISCKNGILHVKTTLRLEESGFNPDYLK